MVSVPIAQSGQSVRLRISVVAGSNPARDSWVSSELLPRGFRWLRRGPDKAVYVSSILTVATMATCVGVTYMGKKAFYKNADCVCPMYQEQA